MQTHNGEVTYFFGAFFCLLLWSLLAGVLLKTEDKWIGVSVTGLTITVGFSFLMDKRKKAYYIKDQFIRSLSEDQILEVLDHSLTLKEHWRSYALNDRARVHISDNGSNGFD